MGGALSSCLAPGRKERKKGVCRTLLGSLLIREKREKEEKKRAPRGGGKEVKTTQVFSAPISNEALDLNTHSREGKKGREAIQSLEGVPVIFSAPITKGGKFLPRKERRVGILRLRVNSEEGVRPSSWKE